MRLKKTRDTSSPALSAAVCGSSPLSLSCQLCSEGDLDEGRGTGLPRLTAAFPCRTPAPLIFVMVSTLITAHSDAAHSFCVESANGKLVEGVVLLGSEGVCVLSVEAAEDKAIAASVVSEGVVGGVWKKSKGEPEGRVKKVKTGWAKDKLP